MCLTITKKSGGTYKATPVAKIAKKPITVYKQVNRAGDKFRPIHGYAAKDFYYELGKTQKSDINVYRDRDDYFVYEGLHSFAIKPHGGTIIECRIPKGAKYYEEYDYDHNDKVIVRYRVSNKLKVIRVVK